MKRNTFKKGFKPYYKKHTYVCGLVTKWELETLYKINIFPNKHFKKWEHQAFIKHFLNIYVDDKIFKIIRNY